MKRISKGGIDDISPTNEFSVSLILGRQLLTYLNEYKTIMDFHFSLPLM